MTAERHPDAGELNVKEIAAPARDYLIMSGKHTRKGDRWITFWRAGDCGYAHRMDWCGRYGEAQVAGHASYYDNRCSTFAIPAGFVLARAIEGWDESGTAWRVPNTQNMWRKMVRAAAEARRRRAALAPTHSGGEGM